MVYTYVIDQNIFEIDQDSFELWAEKINNFFKIIKRNSVWIDCVDEGNLNKLFEKYNELYQNLENDYYQKMLEDLWFYYFREPFTLFREFCHCDNISNCSVTLMISNLKSIHPDLPSHLFYYKNEKKIDNINKVNINDYRESDIYKDIIERSAWQTGPIVNDEQGIEIMKSIWAPLIKILKNEIIILDRNVFEKWNSNYEAGLRQFSQLINSINPNLTLKIISRKNVNIQDAREKKRKIEQFISTINSPKIELILSDRGDLFDHGRFIKFDEIIAGKLERGLDEFHSTNQRDECRISYWHVDEVNTIISQALHNEITEGEFSPIRNFE